jgi:hypothetical protein
LLTLRSLTSDPIAATALHPVDLSRPAPLAVLLGDALTARDWEATATGWRHRSHPATDANALDACRDLVREALADFPTPARVALVEAIARDRRTLAHWERHPLGAGRADYYRHRLGVLRERLTRERSVPDPLAPLRLHLTTAARNLQGVGFCGYFLDELRDVMTAPRPE